MDNKLFDLVEKLVRAENEHDPTAAEPLVAQNFTGITRARGEEQNREKLLGEMANPKNPNIHRHLDQTDFVEMDSGDLGIVRSLVTTTDQSDVQAHPKKFRNLHVFENQQGKWCCVAWQVTELKEPV